MKILYSFFISILILLTINICAIAKNNSIHETNISDEIGQIIKVLDEHSDPALDSFAKGHSVQTVKVKVLTGKLKDKDFIIENVLSGNPAYDIPVKEGNKVVLSIENLDNGNIEVNIANLYRLPILFVLIGVFALLLLIFGGIKGLKALISLGITYFLVFYFLVPSLLSGSSPLLITIIICLIATGATIFIISGINLKSLSAVIGTVGGVIAAALMALVAIQLAPLTGIPNHEAIGLWTEFPNLDYKGILASAMIIGALGASMDVAISVASSIFEIKQADPTIQTKQLIKSGMNVGKDIMGTMTNTLLLAYTGSAMFLLLLVYNNVSLRKLLNLDSVLSEITAALAGSIGLILCIPITAIVAGYLMGMNSSSCKEQKDI